MNHNVLSEKNLFSYDRKKIKEFSTDLHSVFHTYKSIYDSIDADFSSFPEKNKKRFKEVVELWNRKYHNIALQLDSDFKLKIFFNISLEDIKGIVKKMIYLTSMEISEDGDTLTAYFNKTNTLTLRSNGSYTRLIYLDEDMLETSSPEFRICTIMGLSEFNPDIDLKRILQNFAFSSSTEVIDWYLNR